MSQSIPHLEPGLQIGDYLLTQLIETAVDRQVWLGEQISVKREVEIVCYFGPDPERFLADIRVKAMVEDGVFGLVYEAVQAEEFIAYAAEVLPERSLARLAAEHQPLTPLEVTQIIAQVAGALSSLDKRGIAREDFGPKEIRFGPHNNVRIANVTNSGPQTNDMPTRRAFVDTLVERIEFGQPGATRMTTLLEYIKGTETQSPIPWSQAKSLALQVHEQLKASPIAPPRSTPVLESRQSLRGVTIAGLIFGLVALILGFFVFRDSSPKVETGLVVTVPAGRYPRPNGGLVELSPFRIDATEVTIGEYAEFMVAWQMMTFSQRSDLWLPGRPDDKTSIRPHDWNSYYPKARSRGTWEGRRICLECPVFGVDWWDAGAYAKWKGGHLPTEQDWWAASSSLIAATGQKSSWGPVGGPGEKIYGLKGNVTEWAGKFSKDPAFPISSPKPVALGGSFKKASKGALTREWLESPTLRRDDLGFRVAYAVEQ
ncbi:SUMF1/EgtB/PvdO family nonheme iron enzyme [Roseibacillus persicicus]|uniref:Sulfatase-modifying factor enzyme-like domain-containing protein n=1 Tax=Roseibacillus persicicus TaxID=454148 RepID=A0A918TSZ5_9BACT|nr:SUMF1/EgtB/PvdO family nonheme iron enzyme [Roseibacillus persicicus]GHC60573.1 hypothetical protein GCM10007100_29940 [Roseibacillus persicicus]